jgi:hypothetical protein
MGVSVIDLEPLLFDRGKEGFHAKAPSREGRHFHTKQRRNEGCLPCREAPLISRLRACGAPASAAARTASLRFFVASCEISYFSLRLGGLA